MDRVLNPSELLARRADDTGLVHNHLGCCFIAPIIQELFDGALVCLHPLGKSGFHPPGSDV